MNLRKIGMIIVLLQGVLLFNVHGSMPDVLPSHGTDLICSGNSRPFCTTSHNWGMVVLADEYRIHYSGKIRIYRYGYINCTEPRYPFNTSDVPPVSYNGHANRQNQQCSSRSGRLRPVGRVCTTLESRERLAWRLARNRASYPYSCSWLGPCHHSCSTRWQRHTLRGYDGVYYIDYQGEVRVDRMEDQLRMALWKQRIKRQIELRRRAIRRKNVNPNSPSRWHHDFATQWKDSRSRSIRPTESNHIID